MEKDLREKKKGNTQVKMDKKNYLSMVYNQSIDIQIMILNYLCYLITL